MSNKAIPGSKSLANKIKQRRTELGLTIEEAASRAGGNKNMEQIRSR